MAHINSCRRIYSGPNVHFNFVEKDVLPPVDQCMKYTMWPQKLQLWQQVLNPCNIGTLLNSLHASYTDQPILFLISFKLPFQIREGCNEKCMAYFSPFYKVLTMIGKHASSRKSMSFFQNKHELPVTLPDFFNMFIGILSCQILLVHSLGVRGALYFLQQCI